MHGGRRTILNIGPHLLLCSETLSSSLPPTLLFSHPPPTPFIVIHSVSHLLVGALGLQMHTTKAYTDWIDSHSGPQFSSANVLP